MTAGELEAMSPLQMVERLSAMSDDELNSLAQTLNSNDCMVCLAVMNQIRRRWRDLLFRNGREAAAVGQLLTLERNGVARDTLSRLTFHKAMGLIRSCLKQEEAKA